MKRASLFFVSDKKRGTINMIIMDISRGMCKTIKECLSKGSKGGISESRVWEWGVREEEQGGRIKGQ